MPLSSGILWGLIIAIAGVGLLLATKRKKIAVVLFVVGIAIALGTAALIVAAVTSGM
jgi:hypothetical protein